MLQHEVMVVDEWQNLCSLSITYACPYHNPTDICSWATRSTTLTSANSYTLCLPFALYSENQDSSVKRTPLQSARRHRMWAFSQSSQLRRRTSGRSRPRWGWQACRWASLRRFLTVCAEIILLCSKLIVAAAVRVSVSDDFGGEDVGCGGPGLVWLHVVCGCEYWMYSHPCWMLDVLPNSLKRLWRWLMVEKWTFNSRTTALVDILQSACQLHAPSKLLWHCGLCFLLSPLTSTKHYYRYIPEYLIRIVITYIYYVLLMTAYYN